MSRAKPYPKGKPIKTEPGAVKTFNQNDKTEQSQMNKQDEAK
jgi:hypothetical protein